MTPEPSSERAVYPVELYPGCPCYVCDSPTWEPLFREHHIFQRMSLCPTCGDKRCPGAMDHRRHSPSGGL